MMVEMSTRRAAAPFNRFNPVISLFDSTSTVAHASSVLCDIYAICTSHIVQSKYSSYMKEIQQEVQGHSWPRLLLEILAGGPPVTEEQEQEESRIGRILVNYIYNIEICLTDSTESSLTLILAPHGALGGVTCSMSDF